jgi:hypothetical protein
MKPLISSPTGGQHLGPVPPSEFGDLTIHPSGHDGGDFNRSHGWPIKSGRKGRTAFAGVSTGRGGNKVVIDYGEIRKHTYEGRFYHFGYKHQPWEDCIFVRYNQLVKANTVIGLCGDSGNARGPHLHFEMWVDGQPQDPLCYIKEYQVAWRPLQLLRVGLMYPKAISADVFVLQRRLNFHGYKVVVDGIYGPDTRVAVEKFQTAVGLKPDGIVGKQTWQMLL